MNSATATAIAKEMGIDPASAIGTDAHRDKWLGKLGQAGFSEKSALAIFRQAMEARYVFGSFSAAVKAYAGTEAGIQSAPAPGKKARWD